VKDNISPVVDITAPDISEHSSVSKPISTRRASLFQMLTGDDLRSNLARIDGRGYKAYKDIQGSYGFDGLTLHIDYVQGDPFAAPSKVRLRVPQSRAKFPLELFGNRVRRIALQDILAREVKAAINRLVRGGRGSGKSGSVSIDAGGQEVIERTSVLVSAAWVEARIQVGLPAAGRRVLGRQAEEMLTSELPQIASEALVYEKLDAGKLRQFVECVENQEHVRSVLDELGLISFVGDGAVLPRESGASDRPLRGGAVPFQSPGEMRVSIELPNPLPDGNNTITGMGIRKGVTLIVGGGYHGKSTLLRAVERGVYPHVPADGREYVVTTPDAVKIRAEDGRRVEKVDISPFVSDLPYGRSTTAFSSEDASGSTSQAANIVEALEAGATALLLDEDTSATNFMVRDARMQALVHKQNEPITPFIDRVRELYDTLEVSTLLVMGGSGDYFDAADSVVMMKDYLPHDATEEAKDVASQHETGRASEAASPLAAPIPRMPVAESFDPSRGNRDVKISARSLDLILFGRDDIELRSVEQLVDVSQTRAIGYAIYRAQQQHMDGQTCLRDVVDSLEDFFDEGGLDHLDPFRRGESHPGNFARPRKYEIASAINRLRTVRMRQAGGGSG